MKMPCDIGVVVGGKLLVAGSAAALASAPVEMEPVAPFEQLRVSAARAEARERNAHFPIK